MKFNLIHASNFYGTPAKPEEVEIRSIKGLDNFLEKLSEDDLDVIITRDCKRYCNPSVENELDANNNKYTIVIYDGYVE